MDYERIHKAQTGIISPSKLRMKIMGANQEGSNSNSSRTSPSRLEDSELLKNSLLASQNGDFGEEVSSLEVLQGVKSNASQCDGSKDDGDDGYLSMQLVSKGDSSSSGSGSSSVHPVRMCEDENLDSDATSSFEFHKHQSAARSLSRPMPSKWNDAEKWIVSKQSVSKKAGTQNQVNRRAATNTVRVVPESTSSENKPSVKRVDFCQVDGANARLGSSTSLPCTKSVTEEPAAVPAIRSVSMRDMGTDMTPIPSQEPSRSTTPITATTPLCSPTASVPSTPRRGEPAPAPAPVPTQHTSTNSNDNAGGESAKKELSEQEQKLKTRREIEALGVQLGKMNIAAWASKDEEEKSDSLKDAVDEGEQIEYAKRADAWEEAEKSKHAARFKREEIRIQAWESQQKARLEAEMRKIEAQIEQIKAQAQAKMVKKVAMARQKSEEKRAAAEASKNRQAEKTAAQADYIRQTGRVPSSLFVCCGWS